jgi:hypothetical protein
MSILDVASGGPSGCKVLHIRLVSPLCHGWTGMVSGVGARAGPDMLGARCKTKKRDPIHKQ